MTTETVTAAEVAMARAAYPLAFRAPLHVRLRRAALWTGFGLLFCWCLYDFNFSPVRIWEGLGRLGRVLSFMFPPHNWSEWREFAEILNGLGETLSMAFLGTLLGAIIAF
ncbi:MAG: phosphonate ABC transporter, permease protein PhnE, partial [Cypionkella sp.]|nr:phosphonate ABC transporter, permease protein PhnE [Cypionkella sp.]